MAYIVSLKQFDGPLDLLLTLISNAKVDIQDIFVSEITEQYLEAMKLTDELDMDSASEFLQMAATLLEIKSRAMLPKPPRPESEDELSPEEALIKQLTEYKQFKEASEQMHRLEARALLTKMPEEYPLPPPNIEITGLTLDKLVRAFQRVLARAEASEQAETMANREILRDQFTVSGCMSRIARKLRGGDLSDLRLKNRNLFLVRPVYNKKGSGMILPRRKGGLSMVRSLAWLTALILALSMFPAFAAGAVASTPLEDADAPRGVNVLLAARAVNQFTLSSGETFSFNAVVGPRTEQRGYVPALNGRGAEVIGGGVGQAAATLYLALMQLEPGTVRYHTEGQWHQVIVSQGFAEVMPDYAILVASTAERPEEIDKARAQRAKERAEEQLRQKQSVQEYHHSKAALARAMARLKATAK